jgi:hypothetical protein
MLKVLVQIANKMGLQKEFRQTFLWVFSIGYEAGQLHFETKVSLGVFYWVRGMKQGNCIFRNVSSELLADAEAVPPSCCSVYLVQPSRIKFIKITLTCCQSH